MVVMIGLLVLGFGLVVLLLGYGLWFAGCFCVSRVVALTTMVFVGVGGVVGVWQLFWYECVVYCLGLLCGLCCAVLLPWIVTWRGMFVVGDSLCFIV